MKVLAVLVLSLLISVIVTEGFTGSLDCVEANEDTSSFVGKCESNWRDIKGLIQPCQSQVGYAWIYRKLKNFSSSKNAQKALNSEQIPVVLGPDYNSSSDRGRFYLVDKHHTLAALDYSGFDETKVTLTVICDLRSEYSGEDEDSFWKHMIEKNLVYLKSHPPVAKHEDYKSDYNNASEDPLQSNDGMSYYNQLPIQVDPSYLPPTFEFNEKKMAFSNDPWRSLAGYARKSNIDTASSTSSSPNNNGCDAKGDDKYCLRCMYRGCEQEGSAAPKTPAFFEFRWAGFMNNASFYATPLWGEVPQEAKSDTSAAGLAGFLKVYNKLGNDKLYPGSSAIEKVDIDAWMQAASILIELCRFSDLDGTKDDLPGAVDGYTKLGEDPSCAPPQC